MRYGGAPKDEYNNLAMRASKAQIVSSLCEAEEKIVETKQRIAERLGDPHAATEPVPQVLFAPDRQGALEPFCRLQVPRNALKIPSIVRGISFSNQHPLRQRISPCTVAFLPYCSS